MTLIQLKSKKLFDFILLVFLGIMFHKLYIFIFMD